MAMKPTCNRAWGLAGMALSQIKLGNLYILRTKYQLFSGFNSQSSCVPGKASMESLLESEGSMLVPTIRWALVFTVVE